MLKPIAPSLIITALLFSPVFADDEMAGTFEQQAESDYSRPNTEKNYLATLAPMESQVARYVGVNANLGLSSYKSEMVVTKGGRTAKDSKNNNSNSYGGGAYGGFGINFSHFYLGAELSLATNLANTSTTATVNDCDTSLAVKQPVIVGLDIMPGYLTNARDILFYGRLGVGSSLYRLKITDTANKVDNSTNKMIFGMRAGLGIEFFVNDIVSIRTEYVYSKYNNSSGSCSSTSGKSYSYNVNSPGVNQFNLGLVLHF